MSDVARHEFVPPNAPAAGSPPAGTPDIDAPPASAPPPTASAAGAPDRRAAGSLPLPDRRLFWRWVWQAVRPVIGWALAALGALALFLGWYGVSGEALTAKQLPYLVSGGLTGIGLIVLAGVFLATEDIRRQLRRVEDVERKVDELYSLFVADIVAAPSPQAVATASPSTVSPSPPTGRDTLVALPSGTSYHRAGCTLVAGKEGVTTIGAATIRQRGLKACRVCEPLTPPAG